MSREAFEAWLVDKHGLNRQANPWPIWKDESGDYIYSQSEWETWQAAVTHSLSQASHLAQTKESRPATRARRGNRR